MQPTDVLDAVMRLDLLTFVERCFGELQPRAQLSNAPYLQILAAKLQKTLLGNGPKRLIINIPPRSLKSTTVSVAAVAWMLGHDPTKQIICASYGQHLADKLARDTRSIMQSTFYRRVFPGTVLSKFAVNDFETTAGGMRMATSVGGVLTGRGGDILILDDPLKPGEGLSETLRTACNDWYNNTLLSRLNNKKEGIIVIVMQRIHQDDLVGHVLAGGEEWEVLSFPAIAEVDETFSVETPFGPFNFVRKTGDLLDPSRNSLEMLNRDKASIGIYNFASQYQQNPIPVGGSIIKTDWLRYYTPAERPERFIRVIQSWDTANKSGEFNDYSVCTTWGEFEKKYYLIDVFRRKLEYPDLRRAVKEQFQKYRPQHVVIEDRGSGTQLLQDLRQDGVFPLKPYDPPPGNDKQMRLHNQSALFENGYVILPSSAPWLSDYIFELTSFPGPRYDDQVDSTTQALAHLSLYRGSAIWAQMAKINF
jgi:predicted phage terminase large subunit-like protein